jgi:Prokaryotic membrane lipoprotein lipid attachment site
MMVNLLGKGLFAIALQSSRRIQMRKIHFFAIGATVILSGVGAWAVLTTRAPVAEAALPVVQIDPSKMMMNARDVPTERFVDYSFVFPGR